MGYQTSAMDARDKALEHVRAAIRSLGEIVVDECDQDDGANRFSAEYRAKLWTALNKLIEARDML